MEFIVSMLYSEILRLELIIKKLEQEIKQKNNKIKYLILLE